MDLRKAAFCECDCFDAEIEEEIEECGHFMEKPRIEECQFDIHVNPGIEQKTWFMNQFGITRGV